MLGRADRAVGGGRHRDRRARVRAPSSRPTSCAPTAPRALAPFKVPKRSCWYREPLPRTPLRQAAAQGAGGELRRADAHREREPRGLGRGGRRRGCAARSCCAPLGEPGLALAGRCDRPCSPASACSSSRPASARRAARRRARRADGRRGHLRPGRGDARRAPARAAIELGLSNVEFQVLNAEWIDLPVASVDAVLCRWGFMLMADPAAALARRAACCAPAGALALAVWDALERNPWALLPALRAERARAAPAPAAGEGARAVRARATSAAASSCSSRRASPRSSSRSSTCVRRHASFEDFWEADARPLAQLPRRGHVAARAGDRGDPRARWPERFAPFTVADGTLEMPGRTLLACASA